MIKFYEKEYAKDFVKTHHQFKDLLDLLYIQEWFAAPTTNVKLYLLYESKESNKNEENKESEESNEILSFALLTLMKRDPMKTHTNPHYFNYIYTFEENRRKGYALELAKYLKDLVEVTVFSTDDISSNLFEKANYIFVKYDPLYNKLPIYRYPK